MQSFHIVCVHDVCRQLASPCLLGGVMKKSYAPCPIIKFSSDAV